jgi:general secretion pathway protein A
MDYFRLLNLKKEPFSNSPDPELFYPSRYHVECLQRLEMAIRLRRGLNVVLGEVGTGKTTLCRRLIQQISTATGSDAIELHLVLDPSFSSSYEFLLAISGYFGIITEGSAMTEWQLKEEIKNYLFAKGVQEGKTVLLLIDEGQKLPDFCLEILREFLNYETNDCKLLQIVILAQREFKLKMKERENFTDRINLCYELVPLGFMETCRMVDYRISQSSEAGSSRRLFTRPALYALYWATGGYPRSLNMLCHQVILGMIIQNRTKAGWSLVRACAARLTPERRRPVVLRHVLVAIMTVLVVLYAVLTYYESRVTGLSAKKKGPLQSRAMTMVTAQKKSPPPVLGAVSLEKGQTLSQVFSIICASRDQYLFRQFTGANPGITNIQIVRAGEPVLIPAVAVKKENITGKVWVQVARTKTLQEACDFFRSYSHSTPEVVVFPFWNQREGTVFSVLLKKPFPDREAARIAMDKLSSPMFKDVKVIDTWDLDTVFYRNI